MQILLPSLFHFMCLTTLLFLLLIISSRHKPLYSVHTIISPFWSLDVSFPCFSFHATTWMEPEGEKNVAHTYTHPPPSTIPECPAKPWFMARLLGAARPFRAASLHGVTSNLSTLSSPSSPPQAMKPSVLCHDKVVSSVSLGIAIYN